MIRKTPFSIRLLLWPIILPAVIRKLSYWGARPYNSAANSLRDTASTLQSLAQAGQIDEARGALIQLKEVFPEITIVWIEQYVPYTARTMAKFLEGMRKAGLE
jgi:hypothetical protein